LQKQLAEAMPQGKMYEVGIKAEPEHFLDWDKPLSQQSPVVQDAIKQLYPGHRPDAPGQDLYHQLGFKNAADASNAFRDAGIPGIRYLDQGSRNAAPNISFFQRHLDDARASGDATAIKQAEARLAEEKAKDTGTHNYVVFNDKLIEIMKKYGLAGMLGGSQAAPMFAPRRSE
jgi:hypothetical protein